MTMNKKILRNEVSTIRMSVSPPQSVVDAGYRIIHNKEVKKWVGIGWTTERSAECEDYENIPEVVD